MTMSLLWSAHRDQSLDDGKREHPSYISLGDDSVPCAWWHPDFGPYCARCGSGRPDLHQGEWASVDGRIFTLPSVGRPWTDHERAIIGLPVEAQWWHQAAGWDALALVECP